MTGAAHAEQKAQRVARLAVPIRAAGLKWRPSHNVNLAQNVRGPRQDRPPSARPLNRPRVAATGPMEGLAGSNRGDLQKASLRVGKGRVASERGSGGLTSGHHKREDEISMLTKYCHTHAAVV